MPLGLGLDRARMRKCTPSHCQRGSRGDHVAILVVRLRRALNERPKLLHARIRHVVGIFVPGFIDIAVSAYDPLVVESQSQT